MLQTIYELAYGLPNYQHSIVHLIRRNHLKNDVITFITN